MVSASWPLSSSVPTRRGGGQVLELNRTATVRTRGRHEGHTTTYTAVILSEDDLHLGMAVLAKGEVLQPRCGLGQLRRRPLEPSGLNKPRDGLECQLESRLHMPRLLTRLSLSATIRV